MIGGHIDESWPEQIASREQNVQVRTCLSDSKYEGSYQKGIECLRQVKYV